MDNNVNDKLKNLISGASKTKLNASSEPIMKLLMSPEGQKLMKSLSPAEKKAIVDRFMSLDKSTVEKSLKNFNPSMLSGMTAKDILDKLR